MFDCTATYIPAIAGLREQRTARRDAARPPIATIEIQEGGPPPVLLRLPPTTARNPVHTSASSAGSAGLEAPGGEQRRCPAAEGTREIEEGNIRRARLFRRTGCCSLEAALQVSFLLLQT